MILKSNIIGLVYCSIFIIHGGLLSTSASAEIGPLPEPLTLSAALAAASNPEHFDIRLIERQIDESLALAEVEASKLGLTIDFKGRIRKVGLSDSAVSDDDNDSAASLFLNKPLYDFGVTDARLQTLSLQHQVLLLKKQHVIQQRHLLIMEKYFDVLNADNEFISENEALAIGFIRFDRARDNLKLGTVAAIDVARLEAEYERVRQRLNQAQNRQRLTRMILAETMGYPGQLSNELELPQIDINKLVDRDIETMIDDALAKSHESRLLRGKSKIAQSILQQSDTINSPRLDFELELSSYARETSTRDDWRASIYLDVPLYSSARTSGQTLAHTKYQQSLSEIAEHESRIRLQVLEYWQSVEQFRLVVQGTQAQQIYRDMYLDRSRAEYEMEFRTDLGDAMVEFSRARTDHQRSLYAFELAYNRLQALVGRKLVEEGSVNETQ